jgi:hypothetical protein
VPEAVLLTGSLGRAYVAQPTARGLTESALAVRDEVMSTPGPGTPPPHWEPAYAAALRRISVDLRPLVPAATISEGAART